MNIAYESERSTEGFGTAHTFNHTHNSVITLSSFVNNCLLDINSMQANKPGESSPTNMPLACTDEPLLLGAFGDQCGVG